MVDKIDLRVLMDLHVLSPPPPAAPNTENGFLEICSSVCMYVSLASAWTVGLILFIFGI
jgi:hypothetical protein